MTDQPSERPIISYCIEHAKTQQSKCNACNKVIPHKSLRVAEIYRRSKKVKKDDAKHTWFHFKCFKVPELLKRVPIEQFRGYPALNEKDKVRVQRLITEGSVGSTWTDLMNKSKPEKTEQELEVEKKKQENKEKKEKEAKDTEDMDMTESLTGMQVKKEEMKKNKDKKSLSAKDKKSKKVTKPEKPKKEVVLPKEDLQELAKFAKEFKALQ
ncbi:hypothetical protein BDF20DRAFT_916565 [Mycotypha africana]|uniref:uncharacterized protein n=1 Tax=Mycotypha africana TaxID=64632 RepID=UPI0023002C32|nr:uncharacterized protein BDF20DRAFT_916565 [Mycotypha africana]KAI8969186.1 hypothetical protein BDF20DRAFT_916565 [Mycotypha africana]